METTSADKLEDSLTPDLLTVLPTLVVTNGQQDVMEDENSDGEEIESEQDDPALQRTKASNKVKTKATTAENDDLDPAHDSTAAPGPPKLSTRSRYRYKQKIMAEVLKSLSPAVRHMLASFSLTASSSSTISANTGQQHHMINPNMFQDDEGNEMEEDTTSAPLREGENNKSRSQSKTKRSKTNKQVALMNDMAVVMAVQQTPQLPVVGSSTEDTEVDPKS
jgi:hypothetical protein